MEAFHLIRSLCWISTSNNLHNLYCLPNGKVTLPSQFMTFVFIKHYVCSSKCKPLVLEMKSNNVTLSTYLYIIRMGESHQYQSILHLHEIISLTKYSPLLKEVKDSLIPDTVLFRITSLGNISLSVEKYQNKAPGEEGK